MVFIVILDAGMTEEIKGVFSSRALALAFINAQPATGYDDIFYRIAAHEVKGGKGPQKDWQLAPICEGIWLQDD